MPHQGHFSKRTLYVFSFLQTAPTGSTTEAEEGVVCEKEKIDRVSFDKMSLTWHVLDL
jgi:hypothetical protein